jgi:hypothetical protein
MRGDPASNVSPTGVTTRDDECRRLPSRLEPCAAPIRVVRDCDVDWQFYATTLGCFTPTSRCVCDSHASHWRPGTFETTAMTELSAEAEDSLSWCLSGSNLPAPRLTQCSSFARDLVSPSDQRHGRHRRHKGRILSQKIRLRSTRQVLAKLRSGVGCCWNFHACKAAE